MVFSKENQIVVNCNCGCEEGYTFINKFGLIWVTAISSNFYTKQDSLSIKLGVKTKRIKTLLKGKKVFLGEAILTEKEILELIEALEKLASEINEEELDEDIKEETSKEKSILYLRNITCEYSKENEYTLELKTPMTIKDILMGKEYRSYDTYFTKEEILLFIKRAKRVISKANLK